MIRRPGLRLYRTLLSTKSYWSEKYLCSQNSEGCIHTSSNSIFKDHTLWIFLKQIYTCVRTYHENEWSHACTKQTSINSSLPHFNTNLQPFSNVSHFSDRFVFPKWYIYINVFNLYFEVCTLNSWPLAMSTHLQAWYAFKSWQSQLAVDNLICTPEDLVFKKLHCWLAEIVHPINWSMCQKFLLNIQKSDV